MIERLIRWGVARYIGGPARSWIYTSLALSGYRLVRGRTGRSKVTDVSKVGKGRKILIEHRPETHAQQLKAEKKAKKASKRGAKAARRRQREANKIARTERRVQRRLQRAARAERRAAAD